MHQDHPGLIPEIIAAIRESELQGGIHFKKLPTGSVVEVKTQNSVYRIERRTDGDYIQGHPRYCPIPTKSNIHGSTWGGSMIKLNFIGIGMHLEFSNEHGTRITTSEIKDAKLIEEKI